MSFDAPPVRARPSAGEAPLDISEVFYSRTDPRGVILACNEVFRRVADYDWDRLAGAPHRLIRHADMPKAVFWLLWDRLRSGRHFGAYFKNRARDGLHYWVFAVATPVDGGYLSVRIKPSSQIFDRVRPLYAAALAREADGLGPAESARALTEDIVNSGFADYDEFMAVALFNELRARAQATGKPASRCAGLIAEIHSLLRSAMRLKHELIRAFGEIRAIPTNLHIVASRLEVYGGPVSTIAENYRLMSAEVTRRLEDIASDASSGGGGGIGIGDRLQTTVCGALFDSGAALLVEAVERAYRTEVAFPGIDGALEAGYLADLKEAYRRQACLGMSAVARSARALSVASEDLKRQMLGLDSIRVLCRVEAGRLSGGSDGLQAIIAALDRFHTDVGKKLDTILDLSRRIRSASQAAMRAVA